MLICDTPFVDEKNVALSTTDNTVDHKVLAEENQSLREQVSVLQHQLDWFKRELFGSKSEKRLEVDPAIQGQLFSDLDLDPPPEPAPKETVTYQRKKKQRDANTVTDTGLRFDESVPVQTIEVTDLEMADIPLELQEVIDEKVSYRLAQRPGSYVVLKYVRKVVKRKDTQTLHCAPAPEHVLEKSVADVSLLSGLLIDKFLYHLPFYRQHQRLQQSGIQLSRSTLTQLSARAIDLLTPIVTAQKGNVIRSRVLAMDETPIKAGRKQKGKMNQAYFWPVYGEQDEVVFYYTPTRAHKHVKEILANFQNGTLLSDGYEAYARYAQSKADITHAECWVHTRRYFEKAKDSDPKAAEEALSIIGALYQHEAEQHKQQLQGEEKLKYRTTHCEPIVKRFWQWCDEQCQRLELLPKDPLSIALKYALHRQAQLEVFLSDPDVPMDTNHLERALRPIPMGRRNWLFCWTEIGAKQVAIIQSLLVTCKLHNVDPYVYLVDVLQRISVHPNSKISELTPRIWKEKFADNPFRSDLTIYS